MSGHFENSAGITRSEVGARLLNAEAGSLKMAGRLESPQARKSVAERFQQIHGTARPILGTCLYGLAASLAAVAFQSAINWVYHYCYRVPAAGSLAHFGWISLGALVVSSLLAGWLLTCFCPEAAGSGIPQAKLAYWKEFGYSPRRIAWIKFIAGVASIGGGQSLGREGPTVQMGSNLASNLAGLLGVAKQNRRTASAAGAAAQATLTVQSVWRSGAVRASTGQRPQRRRLGRRPGSGRRTVSGKRRAHCLSR